jgi:2-oxoglutarate dehydrogenase E2 component (dihydrolipoamide succinyltransferase)
VEVEVKVPQLAESVVDATLMAWQKAEGEAVTEGENLIDLETDKVTLEVTAPASGVLKKIVMNEGDTAEPDDVIAIIDTDGQASAPAGGETAADTADAGTGDKAGMADQVEEAATGEDDAAQSPAVRKLIAENDLNAADINGSGKGGRITKEDVQAHLQKAAQPAGKPAASPTTAAPAPAAAVISGDRTEERVAMTRLRKRAAERLLQAQHENALLTTFNEVNMQPVMDLRERYKDAFEKRHGVRLGFMSFFVKAAIEALKRFPVVNASVDDDAIVYHSYFDIGIAVSAPRGLVVPVVRDADALSFGEVEATIRGLGEKARDNQLTMEDLTGGTFTITNGGVFGSLVSTPIINPPQSAILGMHKIQDRPIAENGQVVIRPMMYLALTYDHRIIDGREAVQFLVTIKDQLEDPQRMLLEI